MGRSVLASPDVAAARMVKFGGRHKVVHEHASTMRTLDGDDAEENTAVDARTRPYRRPKRREHTVHEPPQARMVK